MIIVVPPSARRTGLDRPARGEGSLPGPVRLPSLRARRRTGPGGPQGPGRRSRGAAVGRGRRAVGSRSAAEPTGPTDRPSAGAGPPPARRGLVPPFRGHPCPWPPAIAPVTATAAGPATRAEDLAGDTDGPADRSARPAHFGGRQTLHGRHRARARSIDMATPARRKYLQPA